MSERERLIQELDQTYQEFASTLEGLGEAQLRSQVAGKWGIREIAAHLADWLGGLERMSRGQNAFWAARLVQCRRMERHLRRPRERRAAARDHA